jgi:GT2 family glycosyltransferase
MDFTVITTTYNDSNNIANYIKQIEKQTIKPTQLIIVDGGSKDNTLGKIISISNNNKDFNIKVISDKGRLNIAQGFNVGIKECKTELMFIGGIGNEYDCSFFEELLKRQITEDFDVVYGPIYGIDSTNFAISFNIAFVRANKGWDCGQASNHGVLIKKKVFDICGYFNENFIYAGEDTEFYRRIKDYNITIAYCETAKLYWETPINWREYRNKVKVNAIADLQEQPYVRIYKILVIDLILILIIVALFILLIKGSIYFLFLSLFIFILVAIKLKSLNLIAIFLKIHYHISPIYYYLKNIKILLKKRVY